MKPKTILKALPSFSSNFRLFTQAEAEMNRFWDFVNPMLIFKHRSEFKVRSEGFTGGPSSSG